MTAPESSNPAPRQQRRGRRIAFTGAERDEFLASERVCRVASVSADGRPHVMPLWFIWEPASGFLWLNSVVQSRRWAELARNPNVSIVMDAGVGYSDLRGVEITGKAIPVGEVPRKGEPLAELAPVEAAWAAKYSGGGAMQYDGRHAWLRIVPESIVSWDFRKLATLGAT